MCWVRTQDLLLCLSSFPETKISKSKVTSRNLASISYGDGNDDKSYVGGGKNIRRFRLLICIMKGPSNFITFCFLFMSFFFLFFNKTEPHAAFTEIIKYFVSASPKFPEEILKGHGSSSPSSPNLSPTQRPHEGFAARILI